MKKKTLTVLLLALLSLSLIGLLSACDNTQGGEGTPGETTDLNISVTKMYVENIEFTNYSINLEQTPAEWDALSAEKRQQLAKEGFTAAVERAKTDQASNYNIQGKTLADADATGGQELAYSLDHEDGTMVIYRCDDGSDAFTEIDRVSVDYP
jgi:hypothetical protein